MPLSFDLAELNIQPNSEIHKLLKKCPEIKKLLFKDGEYIVQEKDGTIDTYIVLRGSYVVEQSRSDPKKETAETLDVVTVDEDSFAFVGEMAYFGGGFRAASVRSSGGTFALCLKPEYMDVIISEFSSFTSTLCSQLTARLKEANRILREWDDRFSMESKMVLKNPDETILKKGERAETLYQLVEGVLVRDEDNQTITQGMVPDGFIDPEPFFLDGNYGSTIKTQSTACLIAISKNSRLAVIRNFPELVLKLYGEKVS